jgi:phage recombination protein Bet
MSDTLTLTAPPAVTGDQLELVKRTVANGATDAELKLFLFDCARQGVHPLDKLLHFTKRGSKYTPVTSIDLMRTRAADTGEYAGSDDAMFVGDDPPSHATVTVWRLVQGVRYPFTATARWAEYYPGDQSGQMWRKMPHTMLGKCAEALALRKGFPRQLAGLYAAEELDQAGDEAPSAPVPARSPERADRTDRADRADRADTSQSPPAVTSPVTPATSSLEHLADGAVLITKVELPWHGQKGGAQAFLFHSGQPVGTDRGIAIYQSAIKALAEECCQARTPVVLAIAASKATGSLYVKSIRPLADVAREAAAPSETGDLPPIATADDAPF